MISQTNEYLRKKNYKEVIVNNSIKLNENELRVILCFNFILEYMLDENLLNIEKFNKDILFNVLEDIFLDTYSYISSKVNFNDIC